MRAANILHLGVKELRGLLRDPMLLILILYSFTISIYTESKAMPESLNKASLAIVDEDRSALSQRIAGAFYPPFFLPPEVIDAAEMDARMDAGLDTFALNLPPDFQRDLLAGNVPVLQLNVDATRMTQAFTGSGYVQAIVAAEIAEFAARHREAEAADVGLTLRSRFNPGLDPAWFGAISEVTNSITLLALVLTGAALIREREHGTVEHLLVMPVTAVEIMLAKIWSMGIVVLAASALSILAVVQGLLQVPIPGSLALFLVGAALHIFATTTLGIFLATVAGTMPQFGLLMVLVYLPLQILSGAVTPLESMPRAIQTIMMLAPNTHFNILAQSVLFRGAGIAVVWPQILALLLIGGVLFAFALGRFRAFLR